MADRPEIDRLADELHACLTQYERAMAELCWTMRNVNSHAALDELAALARSGDAKRHPFSTGLAWAERAEAAEAALRAVAAQPHAPIEGVGTNGAVHVYTPGHLMGCPICQALEGGLA